MLNSAPDTSAQNSSASAGLRSRLSSHTNVNRNSSTDVNISLSSVPYESGGLDESATVEDDIIGRLKTLFGDKGPKLQTEYILGKFSDLGDQYAVLFRRCLKSCAKRDEDGLWKLNNRNG
jgi:hypothetical protein